MTKNILRYIGASVPVFFALCLHLGAVPLYVATNGTSTAPYDTWAKASTNIQWAVSAAVNDDTVWISNGVYVLTNQITVTKNITISGIATGDKPVVNGNNAGRCFEFTSAATGVLANLFITRGYINTGVKTHTGGGGLLMCSGTVRDCVFSNNTVAGIGAGYFVSGGGAYFAGGTNLIQSCTFVANNATGGSDGGGLSLRNTSRSIISGCTFRTNIADYNGGGMMVQTNNNNTLITGCDFICNVATGDVSFAGGGYFYTSVGNTNNLITGCTFDGNRNPNSIRSCGGMYLSGAGWICSNSFFSNNVGTTDAGAITLIDATVKNCVIANNRTAKTTGELGNDGGGIIMRGAGALVQDCIIEENQARDGSGVQFKGGILRNCLIRNNYASRFGGGVNLSGAASAGIISSCTIVSNFGGWASGGISDYYSPGGCNVENCIIYFNNVNLRIEHDTSFTNCCTTPALAAGAPNANNISADPQFVGWTTGNCRLSKYSLCVNAGVNRDWMTGAVDLDGHRRVDIFSGLPDMGCYE